MAQLKTRSFFEDHFFGMNLRMDSDKIPDGASQLAVNVDLTGFKRLGQRKGTSLLGQAFEAKERIQSLQEITNANGTSTQYMVKNGSVYKYNSKKWIVIHSGAFTGNINVPSVVYKQRLYMTSSENFLQYSDGADISDVGTGSDRIKGKSLAVGQRTLFIGNVSFNGVEYPDRVYYSRFDIDNRIEGDEFWETSEGNLTDSTRFFRVEGGNVRAMASFANRDRVYIFSDTRCYAFNVSIASTNPFAALQEIFPIGCAGPNAVKVVSGSMYWMDRKGKMYVWGGGTTRPEEISYAIDSENTNNSIPASIDKADSNLTDIAAFGISKQIYFSVGTINIANKQIKNACIKLFLSQNGFYSYNSVDTFPERPLVGEDMTIDSSDVLVLGNSSNVVYLSDSFNDIDGNNQETAIDAFYRTKSYKFGFDLATKTISNIFIQYKPQPEDSYLNVKVSEDKGLVFRAIASDNKEGQFGVVNMKQTESTDRQIIKRINMPNDVRFENISFEFSNKRKDQSFEINGFGSFDVKSEEPDISLS